MDQKMVFDVFLLRPYFSQIFFLILPLHCKQKMK